MAYNVITVTRQFGSLGRKIARKVADNLGYEYYDRDAIFICSADTLLKIAAGKLDPVFAFTTGKLKVEGSLDKALELQKFL